MALDNDTRAAKDFFREVRQFAERAQVWDAGTVWYETMPDERFDLSLVSARVYGRRDEFLAVMAAAGLDGFDQPLTERVIVLPNDLRLAQIKRATGFESIAALRGLSVTASDMALPEQEAVITYPTTPGGGDSGGGSGGEALMAEHLAAADPHPQYIDDDDVVDGGNF